MNTEVVTLTSRARPLGNYPHVKRVGEMVYLSGVSARLPDGSIDGTFVNEQGERHHDVARQTRVVLKNVESTLKDLGATLRDCVDMTVFLTCMADFPEYNAAYGEFFDVTGPARTTVGVQSLPHPDMVVEMKVLAYVPLGRESLESKTY